MSEIKSNLFVSKADVINLIIIIEKEYKLKFIFKFNYYYNY